jgi:hypothetical protein
MMMMRLRNILLSAGAALLLLSACEKEEIFTFDREESGIFFQYRSGFSSNGSETYNDTTAFSFASLMAVDRAALTTEYLNYVLYGTPMTPIDNSQSNATDYLISLPIKAFGSVKDYDRPVKIVIDDERTTAVQNVHYEVDLDNVVISAGEGSTTLPVRILRTQDMLEQTFNIAFKLQDNEHFKIYFQTQKNTNIYTSTGRQVDVTRFLITASELYVEPSYWRLYCRTDYFGTWSARKYMFVNTTLGWSDADWTLAAFPISKVITGRFAYSSIVVRKALQKLADAGTPMRETDGSLMQLSSNYAVDYSAYE